MRHRVSSHVLFKSLIRSLFTHGTIQTSEAKAKTIKGLIDKIINLARSKTSHRLLQSYLVSKPLRERLIKDILPKMENRVSGYTSLIRLGRRFGDNTMMVKMSLIGAEELKPIIPKSTTRKKK